MTTPAQIMQQGLSSSQPLALSDKKGRHKKLVGLETLLRSERSLLIANILQVLRERQLALQETTLAELEKLLKERFKKQREKGEHNYSFSYVNSTLIPKTSHALIELSKVCCGVQFVDPLSGSTKLWLRF